MAKTTFRVALPFRLLSGPDHAVVEAQGAWCQRNTFGRKCRGIPRTTPVIDEDGEVGKVFVDAKPADQAREVAAYLQSIASASPPVHGGSPRGSPRWRSFLPFGTRAFQVNSALL